jgi:hypothetical protein
LEQICFLKKIISIEKKRFALSIKIMVIVSGLKAKEIKTFFSYKAYLSKRQQKQKKNKKQKEITIISSQLMGFPIEVGKVGFNKKIESLKT